MFLDCYYLVDAGYCNAKGFLAPFRGQRYHLSEFQGRRPQTPEEYFNMKHCRARNVIERCFGLLKGRWKILASPSFFRIQTQVRIIIACCLLHNLIRREMAVDPEELEPDTRPNGDDDDSDEDDNEDAIEYITTIEPSDGWATMRSNLALEMYNRWQATSN